MPVEGKDRPFRLRILDSDVDESKVMALIVRYLTDEEKDYLLKYNIQLRSRRLYDVLLERRRHVLYYMRHDRISIEEAIQTAAEVLIRKNEDRGETGDAVHNIYKETSPP